METARNDVEFSFDSGGLALGEIERLTAERWADLLFDRETLTALKRDGLALEGVNLGGQSPYRFCPADAGSVIVSATGDHADALIDLWRVHFLRALKSRNLAA
jgi:hypothetical protein